MYRHEKFLCTLLNKLLYIWIWKIKNRLCHSVWHLTHQNVAYRLICLQPAKTPSLNVDIHIWNEHQDLDEHLVMLRGEELAYLSVHDNNYNFSHSLPPPSLPPLLPSLPPSLSVYGAGVLSVSRVFLFMVHGFYLPKMIPLWRHEARQRRKKKKSH